VSVVAVAIAAAGGIGWMLGRGRDTASVPSFDRVMRLVSTAAHEFGPVISPDGKWVAYLSNARGPTDVWVKFIAGGDPVNLTASADITVQSQDYIGGLAVSPDGSQIAFQAQSPTQLGAAWVIPAPTGGAPRRALPTGNSGLQWSPDGKRIAYIKTGGSLGDALMVANADAQNEIEIVKREGARHVHWIRWDSTGTFIYFNRGFQNFNTEPTEIFRVAASGGPIERVVASARRAAFPFPSPDGRGLYYAANPDGVDSSLWWRDGSNGRDYRLTTGVGEYTTPSVSADGRRLVGTIMEVRQSLERVAVAFEQPTRLEPITDGLSGEIDPVWSPDGTRLVFSSSRTGNRTLWAARPDLTQPAPLTSGNALDERPAYSPDGQQVAFVSDRGGTRGIWLISAEAGAPRLVGAADVVDTISWSPDGRRLVFSTPVGDAPGLMTMDVATGKTTPVSTPAAASAPSWSPRDDVIAYIEPRGGGTGSSFVRFVRSNGQAVHAPADVPGQPQFGNGLLSWSPDGRRLAAVSMPGAFAGSIWIVEPEGAAPLRKLVDLPAGVFLRGLAWSPDGSSLIVGRIRWTGDIFYAERSTGR
jgi:Tol biopolymer transport system component